MKGGADQSKGSYCVFHTGSRGTSQVIHGNNVDWVDRNGQLILLDHHNHFGRNGEEIAVRNGITPAVRKPERKRLKAFFQSFPYLLNHSLRT